MKTTVSTTSLTSSIYGEILHVVIICGVSFKWTDRIYSRGIIRYYDRADAAGTNLGLRLARSHR